MKIPKSAHRVLIALTVAAFLGVCFAVFQQYKEASFPPVGIACFDQFMNAAQSGYADPELNLPQFNLNDVSSFRCASKLGFEQYEITGTDSADRSFYVHHIGGGVAASGADSFLDYCYKSDGKVVKSIRQTGRDGVSEPGSCTFNEALPQAPDSAYSFFDAQ